MIFVIGLENQRITVSREKDSARGPSDEDTHDFGKDDHEALGNLIAETPGKWRVMASSSCDFPEEAGFEPSFRLGAMLDLAILHAYRKVAPVVEPGPVTEAVIAIERARRAYGHGFPLPLMLARASSTGTDSLSVFETEADFEFFLSGLKYANRLAGLTKGT